MKIGIFSSLIDIGGFIYLGDGQTESEYQLNQLNSKLTKPVEIIYDNNSVQKIIVSRYVISDIDIVVSQDDDEWLLYLDVDKNYRAHTYIGKQYRINMGYDIIDELKPEIMKHIETTEDSIIIKQ